MYCQGNSPRQVGRQTRGPDSAYMTSCERCQRERERESSYLSSTYLLSYIYDVDTCACVYVYTQKFVYYYTYSSVSYMYIQVCIFRYVHINVYAILRLTRASKDQLHNHQQQQHVPLWGKGSMQTQAASDRFSIAISHLLYMTVYYSVGQSLLVCDRNSRRSEPGARRAR